MSQRVRRGVGVVLAAVAALALTAAPAPAHDFDSTAYVDLTSPEDGLVRAELRLDSYLLVVSTSDFAQDIELGQAGGEAQSNVDYVAQAAALDASSDSVLEYLNGHLRVTAEGQPCTATLDGPITNETFNDQPYVRFAVDYRCPEGADSHEVFSELFPSSEGYVSDAKTLVTFDLDLNSGTAILDAEQRSFSTHQSWPTWFWSWFRVGAEHLIEGPDHILFLLALIVGSRRLREVVLTATTFTIAHSVTFILAALGVVDVPGDVVEPIIALSIAVVAGWYLWRGWRLGPRAAAQLEVAGASHLRLDRAGWGRLAVVFCFGLVHGLGFAGALGIDEAFSWKLLSSLLVFNVGIEAVQLGGILLLFPVLALLRRRSARWAFWTSATVSAGVALMGSVWFVERVVGG